ncbi:hypothetical protein CXG81DRAFT_10075 [Caulochytrium protostelioides]|uniref:glycine dehydrogenase (aminomethyl-transferring) n=1 Tax=Caulochytrium protostelioides TaxID=1555241 RepID=A0A4P9XC76_9FUNG|nr:hypothetical protein CXG81DRAFT_10075 [Caulochytrium protostelioides]|eukprot:RKP03047.1 hypothetical protein CXG81DRAFT_10075 [Caulochytrium protostelioides]
MAPSVLPALHRSFMATAAARSASLPRPNPVFDQLDTFPRRHIGPDHADIAAMCQQLGHATLEAFTAAVIPPSIQLKRPTRLGPAMPESEVIDRLRFIAAKNKPFKSYIGMGYTDTTTPPVIARNILENPGWYTQYTPYQAEIAQGRLESLLNFQTMVADLTGLPMANASLLDEGTAAAEAMIMAITFHNRKRRIFFIDKNCHPQTIACVRTRADAFPDAVHVIVGDAEHFDFDANRGHLAGILLQYPGSDGRVVDLAPLVARAKAEGALVAVATDLLALTLLKPPGEFGADMVLGNSQRFGVPMGYGGPHAAFFAVREPLKRRLPGRIVGVSRDTRGERAYRLALQTREQHIRREKAASNICTAQALLANMAAMYAVYHGPHGLRAIAARIHGLTTVMAEGIRRLGHTVKHPHYFDTLLVELQFEAEELVAAAAERQINVRPVDARTIALTFDETTSRDDLQRLLKVFATANLESSYRLGSTSDLVEDVPNLDAIAADLGLVAAAPPSDAMGPIDPTADMIPLPDGPIPAALRRTTPFLTHPVFNAYHSETELLRYITHLQSKDLSLAQAMIPLGSCTMKLNATTEMLPISWPEFAGLHPFAPITQASGYRTMMQELEYALGEATGFDQISLQPNSGAQGEYTGLRVIRAYLQSQGQGHRDVCLIPVSAHGTNPASAALAGFQVVTIRCEPSGNLDLADLRAKATQYQDRLAATMITYPSTYGVFEDGIVEACAIVHAAGGQVYMDGANLNAQLGLCNPAEIGADVCHLNLHKTFCIPHGGGGPGMGPIGVKAHLAPFLPGHPIVRTSTELGIGPVSAAPFGSASILPISWAYLKMMGDTGLRQATQVALLNANYMRHRLAPHYKVLYTSPAGYCAHEFILDVRPITDATGIDNVDIAKRLHDYGFHSPTMSFPVPNTLMIEPTESESKAELDRFCDAMIAIRAEIRAIEAGDQPRENNVLTNAPHPMADLLAGTWDRPYSREQAAYPLPALRYKKHWPTTTRIDDTYGDRNLICSCPPIDAFESLLGGAAVPPSSSSSSSSSSSIDAKA